MHDLLQTIHLCSGVGSPGKAACWMSSLSQWAGGKWTDTLDCVDVPINRLCIAINDGLSDEARNRLILPILFMPIDTRGDGSATKRRTFHLVDAAVRVFAADAMESAGLAEDATHLRNLPCIKDKATARYAARYAANDAANYAARAAARYAANAARYAANDAANGAANYAANAANYAARAAANYAAEDHYIETRILPVLFELIEMGPHAPREVVPEIKIRPDRFLELCGVKV